MNFVTYYFGLKYFVFLISCLDELSIGLSEVLKSPSIMVLLSISPLMAFEVKWSEVKVAQSFATFCNPVDYTVHGILQARILEWVAFPFCRRSSQPRDQTQVSHIAGGFFTRWATREA